MNVRLLAVQLMEFLKEKGLAATLHEMLYYNRVAVVVVKELERLRPVDLSHGETDLRLMEIGKDCLDKTAFNYLHRSRAIKAARYLEKGYRGYALVKGNTVIGDVWYFDLWGAVSRKIHRDLKWLGVDLGDKDAYGFDMYVSPQWRGNLTANLLLGGMMHRLRELGCRHLYGCYFADNIPALWSHKMLGFTEIKRLKKKRFLKRF